MIENQFGDKKQFELHGYPEGQKPEGSRLPDRKDVEAAMEAAGFAIAVRLHCEKLQRILNPQKT